MNSTTINDKSYIKSCLVHRLADIMALDEPVADFVGWTLDDVVKDLLFELNYIVQCNEDKEACLKRLTTVADSLWHELDDLKDPRLSEAATWIRLGAKTLLDVQLADQLVQ